MNKILSAALLLLLAGCSTVSTQAPHNLAESDYYLIASGYSQISSNANRTQAQNRYHVEINAKLNAYRELAKQLYSERLTEQFNVAEQVIGHELYRTYLDVYLRSAKIIESTQIARQKKIVLKLSLTPRFYHCMSSSVSVVSQCLQEDNKTPFTRVGYKQVPVSRVNLSCATLDCSGNMSISGFSKEKSSMDKAMLDYGFYDSEWLINVALRTALRVFVITEF